MEEMKSMKGFEVYDEIPIETVHKRTLTMHWTALGWSVGKRRVKFAVDWLHADASKRTWTLTTLSRLLLLLSLFTSFFSCHRPNVGLFWPAAISSAFLHALMFERLFMRPPIECYPESNCLWLLKRSMYGLKQAPALWQIHFAKTMMSLGFHGCRTDPNLYCHSSKELYRLPLELLRNQSVPQPLNNADHKTYRAIVGKRLWFALIRPDISYATKELSRDLTAPTTESVTKVKHLLRYISGTRDHCQRLCPSVTMSDSGCTLDIDCSVGSDWAWCRTTRKSTSGTVVQLLNSTVSFGSRTQRTIALSLGEAELYAIGQGTSEALFVKNLIIEAKLAKSVNVTVHPDSTGGKSMATRFGTSKKTKHVELKFLYVQELVAKGNLRLRKVGTKVNCADVFAKYFLLNCWYPIWRNCVFSLLLIFSNCSTARKVSPSQLF